MLESVIAIFPSEIRAILKQEEHRLSELQVEEIRIGVHQPLICKTCDKEFYIDKQEKKLVPFIEHAWISSRMDIETMIAFLSKYSIYAYEEELKGGFITLEGGHRVGIAGQVVMEQGKVTHMAYISSLNIRIAHQRIGCASELYPYLYQNREAKGAGHICHTLIVSSVGIGKTTCLRDCIRLLSGDIHSTSGVRVGVVDERSEIAACHLGVPQNDLGIRTDVLDRCLKSEGMLMLLRSMAPDVIAVDELGSQEDFMAVEQVMHAGVRILGTMHAADMTELTNRLALQGWIQKHIFERYIIIRKTHEGARSFEIYDKQLERIR